MLSNSTSVNFKQCLEKQVELQV